MKDSASALVAAQLKLDSHAIAIDRGNLVEAAPLLARIRDLELELAKERERNARFALAEKLDNLVVEVRAIKEREACAHETLRAIQVQLLAPPRDQAPRPSNPNQFALLLEALSTVNPC